MRPDKKMGTIPDGEPAPSEQPKVKNDEFRGLGYFDAVVLPKRLNVRHLPDCCSRVVATLSEGDQLVVAKAGAIYNSGNPGFYSILALNGEYWPTLPTNKAAYAYVDIRYISLSPRCFKGDPEAKG